MKSDLSEQELVRREKLDNIRALGNPFPNNVKNTDTCEIIRSGVCHLDDVPEGDRPIHIVSGRIIAMRLMGKAAFIQIQDRSGKLQAYIRKDAVGDESFLAFKKFDIGDIVEVQGFGFKTKTDEPSLHVSKIRLLVKCLSPLADKWHGLSDVEVRYRQRYLDLIVNPEVRNIFVTRSRIISGIREYFNSRDYIEAETPMMSSVASGASAKPFTTHHNALSMDLFMRIALELPLKKLVVGGLERVYEIGRVFRNEGISTQHNPEFTMIEFYQAYANYQDLMELTEDLIHGLSKNIIGSEEITFGEHKISYAKPWRKLTMVQAVREYTYVSEDCDLYTYEGVLAAAKSLGLDDLLEEPDYGKVLYEIFDRLVESKLIQPTFITQFPLSVSPLARKSDDDPRFCDRFELMVAGMELANGFSELNDPEDQLQRFQQQQEAKAQGDEEAMDLDEDFIKALEFGLPPTAGEGIGIDRLVMLLTGSASIRDVILFPQMRPVDSHDSSEGSLK